MITSQIKPDGSFIAPPKDLVPEELLIRNASDDKIAAKLVFVDKYHDHPLHGMPNGLYLQVMPSQNMDAIFKENPALKELLPGNNQSVTTIAQGPSDNVLRWQATENTVRFLNYSQPEALKRKIIERNNIGSTRHTWNRRL